VGSNTREAEQKCWKSFSLPSVFSAASVVNRFSGLQTAKAGIDHGGHRGHGVEENANACIGHRAPIVLAEKLGHTTRYGIVRLYLCRPFRAGGFWGLSTWASARQARFSPGYNIAGFQPQPKVASTSAPD